MNIEMTISAVENENARALLAGLYQQRLHWSTMITTLMGFTLAGNAAIGTFIGSYIAQGAGRPAFYLVAAAVSAIMVGFWRFYSRYLDDSVAHLYPEIFAYERKLGVPNSAGIWRYLSDNIKSIRIISDDARFNIDKTYIALDYLARNKKMGRRGHILFDIASIVYVVFLIGMGVFALRYSYEFNKWSFIIEESGKVSANYNFIFYSICGLLMLISLIFIIVEFFVFQRAPSQNDIDKAINAGVNSSAVRCETSSIDNICTDSSLPKG